MPTKVIILPSNRDAKGFFQKIPIEVLENGQYRIVWATIEQYRIVVINPNGILRLTVRE